MYDLSIVSLFLQINISRASSHFTEHWSSTCLTLLDIPQFKIYIEAPRPSGTMQTREYDDCEPSCRWRWLTGSVKITKKELGVEIFSKFLPKIYITRRTQICFGPAENILLNNLSDRVV